MSDTEATAMSGSTIVALEGRPYKYTYIDTKGNEETVRGRLRSLDKDGFIVIEKKNGKHVMIPKELALHNVQEA
jgi:hypothetical protein